MEGYIEERRSAFFKILQEKLKDIREAAQELELEDDLAMFFIGGLYKEEGSDDEDNVPFQAMADYHVSSGDELDEVLSIGVEMYQKLERGADVSDVNHTVNTENWGVDEWMKYIDKNSDPNEPKN
tara:strand:+ start:1079 stop:1453 length:375 start_codon:yes stop_codon:yes gene_type:complete